MTTLRTAYQIELAAQALRKSGAVNPTIYVVAHSQGTKVFDSVLPLLSAATKSMIAYYGNGGEMFIPNDIGLKSAVNYMRINDPVPRKLNYNKQRAKDVQGHTFTVYGIGYGGDKKELNLGAHSWVANYQQLYDQPNGVQMPRDAVQVKLQYPPKD